MTTIKPWGLPTSLTIGGVDYPIRADFRAVLDVLSKMSSPKYDDTEKWLICFRIMFPGWRQIPREHYQEAAEAISAFIDAGIPPDGKNRPTTMDWNQDAPLIIPAVNRVLGREVREAEFLHWWTFVGAYMEIGQSLFSSVLNVRQKKAKGKKLDKSEQEFYRENRHLIDLQAKKQRNTDPEELEALKAALGKSWREGVRIG